MNNTNRHPFKLTLPSDVKSWMQQQAEKNLRSQSSEIILAMREKMERQKSHEAHPEQA